ncbi:MAG: S8 family serine peptidase [Inquilinus limosus]|uniref:S8 family serine peptidase n=1 Tax=Inquilinus limosus TaxID=171674 RepID=A0A952KFR7_9PROT|nr:S8 family serine peptidase [Inquilinus limosus]
MPAPTDPLYAQQWHLTGPWGINLGTIWDEYTGAGVVVAVHDQGIDFGHPDLNDNIDTAHSFNASTGGSGGAPRTADDNHGTAVAGIIAAERNGTGAVGIAYGATLLSYYDPLFFNTLPTAAANARDHAATQADVLNNSWGYGNLFFDDPNSAFVDNFSSADFAAARTATLNAAANGRGGLGTIIVQAAGNAYGYGDDTNLHSFQNNRWTITVGATNQDGSLSDYSTPGASILVGAPGSPSNGTIVTTDRVGNAGYAAGDYTSSFNGTSAATPMISGIVALMLDANPNLGWRDVQEILAYSARTAPAASGDQTNGATNWNGGGLTVNHDIGFGLVDAHAAVRLAESWSKPAHTSANEISVSAAASPGLAIPDGSTTGVTTTLTIGTGIEIDRVEVTLNITHSWIGDLQIVLTSPDGTQSVLVNRPGLSDDVPQGASQDNIAFTFGTVQDWGESGQGVWSLTLRDLVSGDTGVLNSWSLHLYGDAASANDTYVYTDEFATVGADTARLTLADGSGVDMINGAALTGDTVIDLLGKIATIAGRTIAFTAGTVIENAITGDGDDQLTGGGGVNHLTGGRGDDVLRGGAGADVLDGGIGNDLTSYYNSLVGVVVSLAGGAGSGGDAQGDTYFGIENVNGSKGADTLTGNGGANILNGLAGDDILRGGAGADVLQGDAGNDLVSYYNSSVGVVVNLAAGAGSGGDAQSDTYFSIENVNGSKSADTLTGNGAANILNGLAGKDVLTGGTGADRFVFSVPGDSVIGDNSDLITDFSHAQGDRIDLSPIDAASTVAGNQVFSFIGSALYGHHAGELRFAQFDGTTIIGGDINGDGVTDFHIRLSGAIALVAADFIL